jgi:hypothetical protein
MSRGLDRFGCFESETWHLAVHVFRQGLLDSELPPPF